MPKLSFTNTLDYLADTYLNWHTIISFIICITIALLLGRFTAYVIRVIVRRISAEADKNSDLVTVNRLRRTETILILVSASQRVIFIILALYIWWLLDHPDTPPTALIGASAVLLLILSASVSPMIRDIASGTAMMIEHWYGVGDHIKIEPFSNMQGVVERVTLRSTRIRNLNGEVIWVNNQNIQGIRLTPKGIRTIALELFVTDQKRGQELIEAANDRLPIGPLLLLRPLVIREEVKVGRNLWHITAVGETAPEREWLIEDAAVKLIKELDDESKTQVIAHGPLSRYADSEAEKKFKRTISNARKNPKTRKFEPIKIPDSIAIIKENQHSKQKGEFTVPGRNKNNNGFTLIELVVAIVVIGILVAISAIGIVKFQGDARDNQRASQTTALSEALEKYYTQNGEYPSVRRIVNTYPENTAANVASTLKISQDILKMPGSNTPQSINAADTADKNVISYSAESAVNNDACQNSIDGGCDRYLLEYKNEAGDTVAISSRYDGTGRENIAGAMGAPTLSAGSGAAANTVDVESTVPECSLNAERLIPRYTFRYRLNNGTWSQWSNWDTSSIYSTAVNAGQKVDFYGKTRCDDGNTAGTPSPESAMETYTPPVDAPAIPSITAALSGSSALGTVGTTTCPAGTAAQYTIRSRINGGTWTTYPAWSTTARTATVAVDQGYKYDFQGKARCFASATNTASGEATTATASYIHPINAPAAPTTTVTTSGTTSTWKWNATSCPTSTTAQYRYQSISNPGSTGAWTSPVANYLTNTWTTSTQGTQYTRNIQTRCVSTYISGGYSTSGSASYVRPYSAPAVPSLTAALSGNNVVATVGAVTCPAGTTAQYAFRNNVNAGTWTAYTGFGTGTTSSQVANQGSRYQYQAKARCLQTSTGTASAEVTTSTATYTRPITTIPSAPSVRIGTSGNTTTWSWNATTTCPAGTTAQYQYQSETDWNYVGGWAGPYADYTSNTWDTSLQGYEYTRRVQTRCYTAYSTGPWSNPGAASYIRPVATPPAPTNYSTSLTSDRMEVRTTFSLSCGSGTNSEFQYMANWDGTTTFSGTWDATGWLNYTPVATQVVIDSGKQFPFRPGSKTRIQARHRCVNMTTNRMSAWSAVSLSSPFTVP